MQCHSAAATCSHFHKLVQIWALLHSSLLPLLLPFLSVWQRYPPVPSCPSSPDSEDNRLAQAQQKRLSFCNEVVPYTFRCHSFWSKDSLHAPQKDAFWKWQIFHLFQAARRTHPCNSIFKTSASLRSSPVLNLSQHSAVNPFQANPWQVSSSRVTTVATAICHCTTRALTALWAQKCPQNMKGRHPQLWHQCVLPHGCTMASKETRLASYILLLLIKIGHGLKFDEEEKKNKYFFPTQWHSLSSFLFPLHF